MRNFFKKIRKNLFKFFLMSSVSRRYTLEAAVFEAIVSADPKKLFVIVLAFNQPELIELHHMALKKFLRDEYEYFIADNSDRDEAAVRIRAYCLANRINYIRLPKNPGPDQSINPGMAFNWVYKNLVERFKPERFGFIDSDLFPTVPVSITRYLDAGDAWGIIADHRNPWLHPRKTSYLWLGLQFHRRARFEEQRPNFLPAWGMDAGARVEVDPEVVRQLPDIHDLHREFIWTEVAPGVKVIRYGAFVHFTGASWKPNGLEGQKRWFRDFLRH